jgi:hypothetical protein
MVSNDNDFILDMAGDQTIRVPNGCYFGVKSEGFPYVALQEYDHHLCIRLSLTRSQFRYPLSVN